MVGSDEREVAQLSEMEEDSVEPLCQIMAKAGIEESRKEAAELLDLNRVLKTRSY